MNLVNRDVEEPMDMSEVQVYGNSRVSNEDDLSQFDSDAVDVSSQFREGAKEPLNTSFRPLVGQVSTYSEQFQEKLKEIDADMAKFDSPKLVVHSTLTPTDQTNSSKGVDPIQL